MKKKNLNEIRLSTGFPYPFGLTECKEGINFSIAAKDAEKLSICFFKEGKPDHLISEIELDPKKNKTGDVWHACLSGLPSFFVYGFRIKSGEPTHKEFHLLDPYAKAVDSSPTWGRLSNEKNVSYRPLGKFISSQTFDWQGDEFPRIPLKDLIIYEMHVRGFTRDGSSQVQHPGTFLGLIEKIPYLLDLGINAVELMPIHEFNEKENLHVNPKTKQPLCNYFGYSTVNFFSPMNRYASQSSQDQAIQEFKTMVRELHKNGIEVILDVVYNHTFEGNEKGPFLSFKGLDHRAYYMIDPQGHYLNFSGCGNTFNCNHPLSADLILNSLRYWVTEMHVDGFRFDLASIFTRSENGTPMNNALIVEAISKDPILSHTKLIAEAWDAGGLYQVGGFYPSARWAEWNGKYRDVVRRFIKGTPGQKNAFATALCGSQDLYGWRHSPCCSINFVTAHDGFSLADLVSYNEKHNFLNGENNRDGFDHNDSWNCGIEGHSANKKIIALRERQVRNFHLALMVSQGVPMILMGDEYCHSRDGNNNTWCQDNELNWFLWDHFDQRPGFFRFFQGLIHFRKNHSLLKRDTFLNDKEITWHGIHLNKPEWNHDNRFIAFTLNIPDQGADLYIAFNASHLPLNVAIPSPRQGTSWYWVVNTHNPSPEDFYTDEHRKKLEVQNYRLSSYSSMMLKAVPHFT